jgi:hypothetical protein
VQIRRFLPIDDDDVQSWNSDEYEAGYQARQEGATASFTATRSWRAGWADADDSGAAGTGVWQRFATDWATCSQLKGWGRSNTCLSRVIFALFAGRG